MRIVFKYRIVQTWLFAITIYFLQACGSSQSAPVSKVQIDNAAPEARENLTATQTVLSTDIPTEESKGKPQFDGKLAFQHIETQLDFGPRTPGSEGHNACVNWMVDQLTNSNWDVQVQNVPYNDYTIKNVIAKRGEGKPWIILGTHYDTRIFADRDPNPEKRMYPVPGANDGASGTAVLLELARVLPMELSGEVWLGFFDAEDNGNIPGWEWIIGSQVFVNALDGQPDAVVIIDMVGDAEQDILWEKNSDPELMEEIWQVAEKLGYGDRFIPKPGYRLIDDHTPFIQADIPAIDIIDFDYEAWHTTNDTIDKVSPESLQVVGQVIFDWVILKISIPTPQ